MKRHFGCLALFLFALGCGPTDDGLDTAGGGEGSESAEHTPEPLPEEEVEQVGQEARRCSGRYETKTSCKNGSKMWLTSQGMAFCRLPLTGGPQLARRAFLDPCGNGRWRRMSFFCCK